MQVLEGKLILAATDLNEFLACRHLTALSRAAATEGLRPPEGPDPHVALIHRKGEEHEQEYLRHLRDREERRVFEIESRGGLAGLEAGAEATLAAMRDGTDVIYQGVLFDGAWAGHADFPHVDFAPLLADSVRRVRREVRLAPRRMSAVCIQSPHEDAERLPRPPQRVLSLPTACRLVEHFGRRAFSVNYVACRNCIASVSAARSISGGG